MSGLLQKINPLPEEANGFNPDQYWLKPGDPSAEIRIEIINGHLHKNDESLPRGLTMTLKNRIVISLTQNAVIEKPIHLLFANTTGEISAPQVLIVAEAGSQATIVETYAGSDQVSYLSNPMTEIKVAKGAHIDHYKIQREGLKASHTGTLIADVDGTLSTFSVSLGGLMAQHQINVHLNEEGAEVTASGFYQVAGAQEVAHHTLVEHRKPRGTSRTLFKGILNDKSRGIFDGRVIVHKNAQKTNATQTNKNLLLSPDAVASPKPQLEIFADDVKCSHGATVGQIDANSLFYFRSRGISQKDSEVILSHAFVSEVIGEMPSLLVKNYLNNLLMPEMTSDVQKIGCGL